MGAATSLKSLLAEADALIGAPAAAAGTEKIAAASEVDEMAALLSGATQSVSLGQGQPEPSTEAEIEKAAMALNRVHTGVCLDAITKVESFETKARSEGYDDSQIQEALGKTAAKKMLDSLPLLVAVTSGPAGPSPDKNALPVRPKKPSLDRRLGRLPFTRNLGY